MNYQCILITGGAGFIGSHVVDAFVNAIKCKNLNVSAIVVFDLFAHCASKRNLEYAEKHDFVHVVRGDVRKTTDLMDVFRKYKVDAVVHLAALSHVDDSFRAPIAFTETNCVGTHVLLEVARIVWSETPENLSRKRFLHVSTDEVYGSDVKVAHEEKSSLLRPTNPYSASKAAAEMLVEAYRYSYGIPTIISRSNNVYGPRQYPEKVIPKFILRLKNGLEPRLQGDGKQKRSFLYCTDTANALLTLFMSGKIGTTYNVGADVEISIRELAQTLTDRMDAERGLTECGEKCTCKFQCDPDRPFNDQRYHIDCSRMQKELGWRPQVDFDAGIGKTIDWYTKIQENDYWSTLPHGLD